MNLYKIFIPAIILLMAFIYSGCTGKRRNTVPERPPGDEVEQDRETGDAYLFDIRIFREGKKNSIRLDLYSLGDSLSFFARGYLGKGVMKGLLKHDSMIACFPTKNEFYSGPVENLLDDCFSGGEFEMMIIDIFRYTPDKLDYISSKFNIEIVEKKLSNRKYHLVSKICPERIELEYDLKQGRFILRNIEYFRNDESFKLFAERRKYKLNIKIPPSKFSIPVPQSASRIIP